MPSFHKESNEMGHRLVRPFWSSLIDVENVNQVVPYKQVDVLDVDKGDQEGSDMPGTYLNKFLVKK